MRTEIKITVGKQEIQQRPMRRVVSKSEKVFPIGNENLLPSDFHCFCNLHYMILRILGSTVFTSANSVRPQTKASTLSGDPIMFSGTN